MFGSSDMREQEMDSGYYLDYLMQLIKRIRAHIFSHS